MIFQELPGKNSNPKTFELNKGFDIVKAKT